MKIASKLKHRVTVFDKVFYENELGEEKFDLRETQKVWCYIVPNSAKEEKLSGSTYSSVSYKFRIRTGAIKSLNNSMYFIYKNQRYNIDYFIPYLYDNAYIDIFCTLVVE